MNEIFAHPNKYGYNLSVNHPVIGAFYGDFFRRFKLSREMGMGDRQRLEYEKLLWNYLRGLCRRYDAKLVFPAICGDGFLFSEIFGWQEEALNFFLTEKLKLSKAREQFAEKHREKLEAIAETLSPSTVYLDWLNGNYGQK